MMTGKVVNEYATFPGPSSPSLNETTSLNDLEYTTTESFETTSLADSMEAVETYEPVQVATIVCFMTGVWSVSSSHKLINVPFTSKNEGKA